MRFSRFLIAPLIFFVAGTLHGQGAAKAVTSAQASPHGEQLKETCATCHSPNRWKPSRIANTFQHAKNTFPLDGAHKSATCQSCHATLDFQATPSTCSSCHKDPHSGEFGATCARCHSSRSFIDKGTSVRTHQATRFPLRGAHAIATCEACHSPTGPGQGQFSTRATTCESCHTPTYRATVSPNHQAAGFSMNCASCHTISSWGGATFDHNATQFALTGKHQQVTCQGCHSDGVFKGKSTSCLSCHQSDYAATTQPRHSAGFPTTCASCHGTTKWQGATFDHQAQTQYPLTGGHLAVACTSCHGGGTYAGTPSTCAACHQGTFDATTTPPHKAARFSPLCQSCHTTTRWIGAQFDHTTTQFPLTGGHNAVTCAGCHADNIFAGKPTACASCHQTAFDATTQPNHRVLGFPVLCQTCHTTTEWRGGQFDHSVATQFPLTGAHRTTSCSGCHSDGVYKGKSTSCSSCHQTDFNATTSPHHVEARFSTNCMSCHTTAQWKGPVFDHNATRFALLGKHVSATCLACHNDRIYAGKASVCLSCHRVDYDASRQPDHRSGAFPTTCESCHTPTGWRPAGFDHQLTRFPLNGAHRSVGCTSCHADGVYTGKPTACASCHQATFDATRAPDHRASGFPVTCQSCHTDVAWQPATFDHNATQFPLVGAHRATSCAGCHADGVFKGKPTSCASCHQASFDATTAPNHRTSGFPPTCQSCHTSTAWTPATFNHSVTQFPLTGAHVGATCLACHSDGVYKGKPTDCASCHTPEFNATTSPNHRTSGFPSTCLSCHTNVAWRPASFDHNTTQFALVGAHRAISCADCHINGVFKGTPTTCVGCHQLTFNATTAPNHSQAQFPTTCASCHTSVTWTPATFNHSATQFPLTGAHLAATCLACHSDGVYKGKPTDCASCHTPQFNATTSPNHRTSGFPTTCASCHTNVAWAPATFDHNTTQFPLAGAHRAVSCIGCHVNGVFKGTPSTCVGCHQSDYNATTTPNHSQAQFSTTCASCHTSVAWTPATFNHSATQFPLTGAHTAATCLACHSNGVYKGTPTDCASCHTPEFNATTNPNHRTAMFPPTCASCHTTTRWTGATFNHDGPWFPIYSGKHRQVWNTCADCHTNSSDYKIFTCLTCHTKTKTDNDHQGRSGYSYNSIACLACHPRGSH